MALPAQVYSGMPRGIDASTALIVLVINVIAPGVGTILAAFLASETENETIFVGVFQLLTSPLLGLGFFWAMAWSIRLYKTAGDASTDEEAGLLATAQASAPAPAPPTTQA